MNKYIVSTSDGGEPNIHPLRIPISELRAKGGLVIVRHEYLPPNLARPKSSRFELGLKKVHRTHLEICARYGLATEDELGIRERTLQERKSLRIHLCGNGQIASVDGLLLEWDGDNIVVRCNSNDGTVPRGMERGAGNRLIIDGGRQQQFPLPDWIDEHGYRSRYRSSRY